MQRKKKDLLPPPANLTAYEEKMLELQMEQLKLQKAATSKAAVDKANKGILLAETKEIHIDLYEALWHENFPHILVVCCMFLL